MKSEAKTLIILYCNFLVTMLFSLVPYSDERYDWFLFYDIKLTFQTYVYFYGEHLSRMMIFYAFFVATERRELLIIFLVEAFDLIDFALTYNETWFSILNYPVEYNDITLLLMFYLIIQTLWKQYHQSSRELL